MDLLSLSRLQFALTIMFHYLFPPLTIGMGGLIVSLEAMFLKTKEKISSSMQMSSRILQQMSSPLFFLRQESID